MASPMTFSDPVLCNITGLQHYNAAYKVNYSGRTSYGSNYFYCRVQPGGLLYSVYQKTGPLRLI